MLRVVTLDNMFPAQEPPGGFPGGHVAATFESSLEKLPVEQRVMVGVGGFRSGFAVKTCFVKDGDVQKQWK